MSMTSTHRATTITAGIGGGIATGIAHAFHLATYLLKDY